MDRYDDNTDLEEHMDVFTMQVGLYTLDDAMETMEIRAQ